MRLCAPTNIAWLLTIHVSPHIIMGIQSRQILRAHDYVWVLNIVVAQHNSWLPMQLVDAQNLPERVSPPACLGVRNLWAGVDKMWACLGV